jgi:hypothetical protein
MTLKLMPTAGKKTLMIMAGSMWCAVGAMLVWRAAVWLNIFRSPSQSETLYGAAGLAAGLVIHRYGFSRLAGKNISRLMGLAGRRSIFAFITVKSYLIIPVMIALGILLRHSPLPVGLLSAVYCGIGTGLFLSGARYFCMPGRGGRQ